MLISLAVYLLEIDFNVYAGVPITMHYLLFQLQVSQSQKVFIAEPYHTNK